MGSPTCPVCGKHHITCNKKEKKMIELNDDERKILNTILDAKNVGWIRFDIQGMSNLCAEAARVKGFNDKEVPFPQFIALAHSELSEALEADRKERMSNTIGGEERIEELADLLIRVFHWAGTNDRAQALGQAVEDKLIYNIRERERMHGGKKY